MNKKSGQLRILAMTLVMSLACSFLQTASAQNESSLTSGEALDLLRLDEGRWSGTRPGVDGAEESSVTIVNRIEAGKWLYFQVAEKVDIELSLSKGTLQFDPESGNFVRRWFENGNAEIKQAKVEFNAEDDGYRYSVIVPVPRKEPAPLQLTDADDASDDSPETKRVTITSRILDADTRLIETYVQENSDDESNGDLQSKLVLKRVKASPKITKASTGKNTNSGSSSKSVSKPAPVTHALKVKVYVGSRLLNADEKPELVIEPEEGVEMKRSGDTYMFTGLKAGETYSVTGKFEFKGGVGRINTEGKISWETSEDWPTKHTMPKNLRLEQ